MRRIKPKLMMKYLLSYVVAFFLPISILIVFFFGYFLRIYREEVTRYSSESVISYKNAIDLHLTQLAKTAMQFQLEEEFSPFFLDRPLNRIQTVKRLRNYTNTTEFAREIILFYRELDLVVTVDGISSMRYLQEGLINYPNWPMQQLLDDIGGQDAYWRGSEPVSIRRNAQKNVLTYICPIRHGTAPPFAVALFQIDEASLLAPSESDMVIVNQQGQVLLRHLEMDYTELEAFLQERPPMGSWPAWRVKMPSIPVFAPMCTAGLMCGHPLSGRCSMGSVVCNG